MFVILHFFIWTKRNPMNETTINLLQNEHLITWFNTYIYHSEYFWRARTYTHRHTHTENTMHAIESSQLQWLKLMATWLILKSPPSLESFTNRVGYDFDGKHKTIKNYKTGQIVNLEKNRKENIPELIGHQTKPNNRI